MDKKSLSERDICTKFIAPAIQQAGWDIQTQVREEVSFTKGRIIVRGKLHTRGESRRADFILYHKPNLPLAIIEAKDNKHSVGAGIQQALDYADALDVPFVFATGYSEHPSTIGKFEPLTLLSALAMGTSRIGLAATGSTTYAEPYHVARGFASLDHLSGGRAAWNVVTTAYDKSAAVFGRRHPPHAERYAMAEEFVEACRALWDSWDDDAVVRNRETGQFFDRDKLHTLNHKGRFFQVAGPLNIGRSPQGQPVIFQAGSSDDGIALAGKYADAVFTHAPSLEETRTFTQKVKNSAIAHGRSAGDVKIFPGIDLPSQRAEG